MQQRFVIGRRLVPVGRTRPLADIRANWEQSFAALERGSKAASRDDGSGFASERQVYDRQRSFGLRMPLGTTGQEPPVEVAFQFR